MKITKFLVPALLTLTTVGCSDDNSPVAMNMAPTVYNSLLRVAHLSPDAPAVDVWVDGAVVLEDVTFLGVSPYLEVESGDHLIQVSVANTTGPFVIDANVTLTRDADYTVAATGVVADLQPLPLVDDTQTGSQVKVRFVHTAPDAPRVDVAVAGGPVLFASIPFRQASTYATVDAGTYDLEVRVAGTETVALSVPGVSLSAGTNVTIFATGLLADGSLGALPVVDAN